ncbi:MAG: metabolite traffic protein EboE [Desulfovibrio sp.]|nr:metabolite traffic protein EboE [Desulfovibrio sp.]MBI4958101.1 metabolite traffic protein EboE [Desulfovibrio sp.]
MNDKRRLPVTYCTNIHPGESWAATLLSLETHTVAVKDAVCPASPFPVGLRVSGQASREIDHREAGRFKEWLDSNGLFVVTMNGFPYGTFHDSPVKAQVYQPDWRSPVRLEYTLRLAELLSRWLPEGMDGSISTVPVGFKADFDPSQTELARQNLIRALQGLDALAQRTGKRIRLSLEPEPGCLLETTPELVVFFANLKVSDTLREHLAVCYDCCHQALQFEDPGQSLRLLEDNSICIGHVQVSSALHLPCPDLSRLSRFDEPVYLHQCVARHGNGSLERFDDLGLALGATGGAHKDTPGACAEDTECWRVHFHLPVFLPELPECLTTQEFLKQFLPMLPADVPLEVETYTFAVLPRELQTATVVESIVREIEWVDSCRRGLV